MNFANNTKLEELELAINSYKTAINEKFIPISNLNNENFGILENLVFYLKTELKISNKEIAVLLNRDSRTVWACLNKTQKNKNIHLKTEQISIYVPVEIFSNRHFSPLEALSSYMHKELHYSVKSIAEILNKNYQSIWITLRNAKKKQK